MGLISFVKSAGEKLFGASEAKPATPDALQKECERLSCRKIKQYEGA
jgi:hypothetical protein